MVDISALEEVLKPCLTTCEHDNICGCYTCEYHGGKTMRITVELELSTPYNLTAEEVEEDLLKAEDRIGFIYRYIIKSIEVT